MKEKTKAGIREAKIKGRKKAGRLVTEDFLLEVEDDILQIESDIKETKGKLKILLIKMRNKLLLVGQIIALTVSFSVNKSIGWALVHGAFGWAYMAYYSLFL